MEHFFTESMSEFWISIMEKLNSTTNRTQTIATTLAEVCQFFDYGCSFIYTTDSHNKLVLLQHYQIYSNHPHLEHELDFKEIFSEDFAEQFRTQKYIYMDSVSVPDELTNAFARQFHAKALIILPILGYQQELVGIIGMVDRRGETRRGENDTLFALSMLAVISNYTKTLLSQQESEASIQTLSSVLDHTGVRVYVTDFETDEILYANHYVTELFGGEEYLIGKNCQDVFISSDEDPNEFYHKDCLVDENKNPTELYIWNYYNPKEDTWSRMLGRAFYWIDGRLALSISSVDITEGKKNEEKIRRFAEYDALTGLGNRHKLLLDCDDGLKRLQEQGRKGYLVFCDLNKFKIVNDTLGHHVGDELLKEIGKALDQNPSTKNQVYRYGGDEFVVLCFDHTLEEVHQVIASIQELFKTPWKLSEHTVSCGTSVGITCYPDDATTTSDLMHHADKAMYEAKVMSGTR
ncbi:diguanylate cyclase [Lachnospiraceae bacterium OttesenSCG-928-E19]|nr:diguanylate cyclase [Lachnospiraceae bacterium OttesenSCG-928-E19]